MAERSDTGSEPATRPQDLLRRPRVVVPAVLVVVAAVVAVLIGVGGADEPAGSSPSSAASTAATPTELTPAPVDPAAPPTPAETPVPPDGDQPPQTLPEVPLDEPVEEAGITGSLVSLEEFQADGNGPGNIDGPALRVTVRLVNDTGADLDLTGVSVDLLHGPDRTAASPVEDRSHSPLTGVLPPGDAAEGVYVFGVPEEARGDVRVEVGPRPGAPVMVFIGSVR
ncbi:hypothetical protein [Blastococcus montanus]|uniref:hypothetical protein n=1 Tax=Blastococcus montanus TaxID=3144973 RepID=UPI003207C4F6